MRKNILYLVALALAACTQEEFPTPEANHSSTNIKANGKGECFITHPELTITQSPYTKEITIDWDFCFGSEGGGSGDGHFHTYDIKIKGKYQVDQSNVRPPYCLPSYYTLDRGDGIMVEVTDKRFFQNSGMEVKTMTGFFSLISGDDGSNHKIPLCFHLAADREIG